MTVHGIQQQSHHPPSGHGHEQQPVFGCEGFTTEVVEELLVEGSIVPGIFQQRDVYIMCSVESDETGCLLPVRHLGQQLPVIPTASHYAS